MKVQDLLENKYDYSKVISNHDEWTSNPITIEYLFKKQMAATHAFMVEILNLLRVHPNDDNLKALSKWKTFYTKSARSLSIDIHVGGLNFPSLEAKYDKMIDAKFNYEEAGGRYDMSKFWEVPT